MFENVESFCRPASVREAVKLLRNSKGRARIIAGCTDLIVEGDATVRCLIDLSRAGLDYIRQRGKTWAVGTTTTMADIEGSAELQRVAGGLLCSAASKCGAVQIRNLATIGGNLANGSPSADLAAALLALEATVVVAEADGRRKIKLAEYLPIARGREMRDALVVEVTFADPAKLKRCGWSFQKFGRTEVDISLVNVAAGLDLDARGRVVWARLVLGAVAPTPIRMTETEKLMTGRVLDQELLTEVGESVMRAVQPISDVRASADYRRELSRVLTGRAIEECAAKAGYSL